MSTKPNREKALERLVRTAMASGVACFVDKVREGEVTLASDGPLTDAFGDFPAEFLKIRRDLVEPLFEDGAK